MTSTNAEVAREVAQRWALEVHPRFPLTPGSPGNFVAPVTRADGTPAVLKVSRYLRETQTEIDTLRLWNGVGAARLLEWDAELGAVLMERVEPGTMLADLTDDDATVRIAASLLRLLWQPAPPSHALRSLESWCATYDRNRSTLLAGSSGFPSDLFRRADELRAELLASTGTPVVLHGDLHHFNILRSDRAGWLAIDPKGLVGDRCFDLCQFLLNPVPLPAEVNRHRLDLFCDELQLDRRRVAQWCLVHAILNACWTFEEGANWRPRVRYAEETLRY